jgi:hypothetical protein
VCVERVAGKGALLIADRGLQSSISWATLRTAGLIDGKTVALGGSNVLIRSMTGGCDNADVNGDRSSTDQGYGSFPTNNEWDKHIVSSTLKGTVTAGSFYTWNFYNAIRNWVKDTEEGATGSSRVARGDSSDLKFRTFQADTYTTARTFRPVLEYVEDGTIFY